MMVRSGPGLRRPQEIHEGAHARRRVALLGIVEKPAGERSAPVFQQRDQLAVIDQRTHEFFGPERDADALYGGGDRHVALRDHQRAVDRDRKPSAIFYELPFVEAGAARLTPVDAAMRQEIGRRLRLSVARDVLRRGDDELALFTSERN